jgi:hypothetical protein
VFLIIRADDCDRRLQEITYCGAFAHEFRVDANSEIVAHSLAARVFKRRNDDGLGCARKNGAAEHHQVKCGLLFKRLADLPAYGFDMTKIKFSVAQAGSADAQKRNFAFQHGGFRIGSGVQVASFMALGNQLAHPRLDNGTASTFDGLDLGRIQINAEHLVALVCQADGRHRSYITQPENADGSHSIFPVLRQRSVAE